MHCWHYSCTLATSRKSCVCLFFQWHAVHIRSYKPYSPRRHVTKYDADDHNRAYTEKACAMIPLQRWLLLLWFCGVTGIVLTLSLIFFSMSFQENHRVTVQEPIEVVYWVELVIVLYTLILTLWIMFYYFTGKWRLDLVRE